MAKARIGHFAEAQVLEALGVDYIDESEVLTPADEALPHRQVGASPCPFVCGATNLGEALRRISEGAAMIRSKGEAGTGRRQGGGPPPALDPRRHPQDHPGRLGRAVRLGQAAPGARWRWCRRWPRPAGCRCRCSAPAGSPRRPTPRWSCSSAPRRCFVGSGIFKSSRPAPLRPGHRRGHHPLPGCHDRGQGQPGPRRRHARRGVRSRSRPGSRSGAGSGRTGRICRCMGRVPPGGRPRSASLALQGDVREHRRRPRLSSAPSPWRCAQPGRPGRSSTAWSCPAVSRRPCRCSSSRRACCEPLGERLAAGMPAFGTCAGMILLAGRGARRPTRSAPLRRDRHRGAAQRLRPPGRLVRDRPGRGRRSDRAACTPCSSGPRSSSGPAPAWRCWPPVPPGRRPASEPTGRGLPPGHRARHVVPPRALGRSCALHQLFLKGC